ncbi:polysaccharide deacetylase family protein [Paenibacillus roseipurpureus]|uniref:Uncharacterized protein n=1 Tax=Paenibacillus roseopurpureus TaxID=2918901 RepID=A0AA96LVH1_9BACL|nr:hypothetical protein [Paenibacillus sp. MBLB1832]WNR46843.1 hypothetical protein MJB10_12365 [Paenibacillus sp. MBLB1832]
MTRKIARIAILLDRRAAMRRWAYGLNVFDRWVGEMLAHAGLPFEWLDETRQVLEQGIDIVIAALPGEEQDDLDTLMRFAARGGIVISYGGLNGLARSLGFRRCGSIGPGYASMPFVHAEDRPLRFLAAEPWALRDDSPKTHQAFGELYLSPPSRQSVSQTPLATLLQIPVDRGRIERWSVRVADTLVGLQQGLSPLLEDGAPAADGTAGLDDGLLKAEDTITLDWQHDRVQTETGATYFAYPYADLWKESIIGHLLRSALSIGRTLPFIAYWPDGVGQVALISHDSDRNHDEDAITTLRELADCGVTSTWCMMKPGYSVSLYDGIQKAGHELALHFNANENEGGSWSEAAFQRQHEWFVRTVGNGAVVSNKNHFTRFEGWGELYRWCEACGLASDQTRGPSKRGTVGFLFGTCHPYFPIAWSDEQNRLYNVLEIGFLSQDLGSFTDFSVVVPLLRQVARVHGVAHFLFHQGRIHSDPAVRNSLHRFVLTAKEEGFDFWTGKAIVEWLQLRRSFTIIGRDANGDVLLRGDDSGTTVPRFVVWEPLDEGECKSIDDHLTELRFGVDCKRSSYIISGKGSVPGRS